jgi:hypothetical protein
MRRLKRQIHLRRLVHQLLTGGTRQPSALGCVASAACSACSALHTPPPAVVHDLAADFRRHAGEHGCKSRADDLDAAAHC